MEELRTAQRIDGSDGALVTRRVVVWRRLEPGDARTEGTEIAPESPYVEAKLVEVGIAESLYDDLQRLWDKKNAVTAIADSWTARYEPAGVLLALGGGISVGGFLDYLPQSVLPLGGSFVALAVAVGVFTRIRKSKAEARVARAWRDTKEQRELSQIEKTLRPRWERFAAELLESTGFRTDLRVGDVHEIDRLVSVDIARITHPDTWKPDEKVDEVRYGWAYADGRIVEQVAELEDDAASAADDADADDEESDEESDDETADNESDSDEADSDDSDSDEAASDAPDEGALYDESEEDAEEEEETAAPSSPAAKRSPR